jgi:methyltransferase (TIGR00027 family)
MPEIDPRKMALQMAGLSVNETNLPEDERLFQDPYAEYFFPENIREMTRNTDWVKAERAKFEALLPGVNGALAARIRYFDERLMALIETGLKQIVIIGAGYDTRPYRIQGVKENCKVFEIDHPLTQAVKIKTIKEIFNETPAHVTYLPMEFGLGHPEKILIDAGYDPHQKTLFIAEGFLMFIPSFAVSVLLTFICKMSTPGGALLADWFSMSVVNGYSPLQEAQALKRLADNEGTPLRFGIIDENAENYFKKKGFKQVECVTAEWCKNKYFKGAGLNRPVSPMFNFVYALT